MSAKPLNDDMDAARWAREFNEALQRQKGFCLDESWMLAWFANAIMCGFDNARRRLPKVNVKVEIKGDGIVGTTYPDVKRVEKEDDGSFTAVIEQ